MNIKKLQSGLLFALLFIISIGIYSCDEDDDEKSSELTQQDRNFLMNAANSNFAEIEFGKVAVQKATNDSVATYAQGMITDHTTAQRQLDSIATILNITVPDSMDMAHRTLFNNLSQLTGPAFDSVYIHNQVLDHQITKELLQSHIDNGNERRLVDYARKQLPKVSIHLDLAVRILNAITNQGQNSPDGENPPSGY